MLARIGLCLLAMLFLAVQPAEARKVALVVGNASYAHTGQLANAENDAALIANAARQAQFDDVISASNLDVNGFQNALREFREKADGADVAMVYYAGHGIEGQGKNWLIPTDAKLENALDLPYEAIDLDRVMEALSGAKMRIAILDACRNNPFGNQWNSGTRAVTRGLAGIEVDDVLVIYAAAPGQTASDGEDINSPFAESLARRLPQADVPIQLLGGLVRDDVLVATDGFQRPFVSASVTGTPVYLVGGGGAPTLPPMGDAATMTALAIPRSAGSGPIVLSAITIECIRTSGFLGLPDDVYIRFGTGEQVPSGDKSFHRLKKGESWTVPGEFTFAEPSDFRLYEEDTIGGDDLIGTVTMAGTIGTHSVTLNGDKSIYKVSYTLTALE